MRLPLGGGELARFAVQILLFIVLGVIADQLVHLLASDHVLLDQFARVLFEDTLHSVDFGVHQRLGEHRLVQLIMAMLPVAYDIHDHILFELVSELHGQLDTLVHLFGTVGVDMEDGGAYGLGDFGAVESGPGLPGSGGESYLVVGDDVDGAFGLIVDQVLHLQCLVDHALAREGRVSVDHHSQNLRVFGTMVLSGSDCAHDNGVDCLEVGRVGQYLQPHLTAILVDDIMAGSEMIFDISGIAPLLLRVDFEFLKLAQDFRDVFFENEGESL